ncbi:MAG: potassium transporter TrkG [Gemmobacter sp.]|uniref:potassium transporter TrkG n=1 Tax=Gemmobacter sp. TaxID=1898957 RepID=UPI00391D2E63
MKRLATLPLPVVLLVVAALLMFLPAAHGVIVRQHAVGRAFFYSGVLVLSFAVLLGIVTQGFRPRNPARSHLRALVLAYLMLPPVLALPFAQAVPDTSFFNAWFEMVSSFTTTGATLYDTPGRLPPSVHLWRGIVGWAGGFFVLVAAAAILAPQNLGGFELYAPAALGRVRLEPGQTGPGADPAQRVLGHALALLPVYAGLTVMVWVALSVAGDPPLVAVMHAMAALATSGISPLPGLPEAPSGRIGEMVLALALVVALTRRLLPGAPFAEARGPLWRDPELRVAGLFLLAVPGALFLRHWIGAIESDLPSSLAGGLSALWGALFTVLSFLTTTGFESAGWTDARVWSGLPAPGLLLLGLVMMGGGVATTAGGVKLLRVYALYSLGRHEMGRLSDPSSVAGGGPAARQMRGDGAFIAFVFFMLFALSLGAANLALAGLGLPFERGLVLSVAALTTTGPLAEVTQLSERGWSGLGDGAKAVLAACMVLGRLETLALLAFLLPAAWRR